jgi:Helix-turn-helix domain
MAGEYGQRRRTAALRVGAAPRRARTAPGVMDQILTSREARQFLKIGRTKLHELTHRQIIPAYRIGTGRTSSLRYLRSDLLGWLVRQRV